MVLPDFPPIRSSFRLCSKTRGSSSRDPATREEKRFVFTCVATYSYLRPPQQKSSTSDCHLASFLSELCTACLLKGTQSGGETSITTSQEIICSRYGGVSMSVSTCLSGCSQRLLNVTCRFPAAGGLSNAKSRTGLSFCHPEGGRSKVSQSIPLSVSSETAAGKESNECGENIALKYSMWSVSPAVGCKICGQFPLLVSLRNSSKESV